MSQTDAAAILGVEVGASRAVVQRAFRNIARSVHPDSGNADEAVKLQQAKAARDTLLLSRGERNRLIAHDPRPWPPRSGTWPPNGFSRTPPSDTQNEASSNSFVSRPSDAESSAANGSVNDSRDFSDRLRDASDRGSNWIVALTLVAVLVVFLVVGAILIVGALFGSSPDPGPKANTTGCVFIADSGLSEVDCGEPGAQRIVTRTAGIVSCATGQNTLIVDETTWCLEFVPS